MSCRPFLLSLCLALSLASAAMAQSYADDVVQQLSGQGYAEISVETTFLGRVRILAYSEGGRREIILNPRTGEILRDLWIAADGAAPKVTIVDLSSTGSGSGSGSGNDEDGKDDSDDNSGSGSDGEDRNDDRNDDRDDRNDDRDDRNDDRNDDRDDGRESQQ